jgi:hypothetical protein
VKDGFKEAEHWILVLLRCLCSPIGGSYSWKTLFPLTLPWQTPHTENNHSVVMGAYFTPQIHCTFAK